MKDLDRLSARQVAEDVVVRLFVATDRRDWASVEACLAGMVIFDVTSMAGGEPLHMTAGDIISGWTKGLEPIGHVHHQRGKVRPYTPERGFSH